MTTTTTPLPYEDFIAQARADTTAASAWADRLERLPDHVLRQTKQLLRACADMTWDQAITLEEFAEPGAFTTAAHREGVGALLART